MKKRVALLLTVAMAASAGAMVNVQAEETDAIEEVAFLVPVTSTEYWMTITEETKAACEEAGMNCTIYSAEQDAATQLQQIENSITMGIDAIIIDPLDNDSTDSALERAREAGIFVIMTGSVTDDTDAYDIGIAASETDVGDAAAKAAAEWIDKTFPDAEDESVGVALFTFPFRPTDVERGDAFANVVDYTSKAKIDVNYEISLTNYATEVAEYASVMLQNYPDVKCVISYSDTFANAIDEILQGSAGTDLSQIANITVDQSTATYTNISLSRDGESTVIATVVPGINLTEQIIDALEGNSVFNDEENRLVYKDITTVTADNIDEYFEG